ncbi:MAG: flagellar export protein FliJ [Psychromonas sp.]|nr:flagellar export protein FliJ [Psychromonas sp.]
MPNNSLQLVYEQREKQVNLALKAYQQSKKLLFEQRTQLYNLNQYRQQYIDQLSQKGQEGLSIADLNKYKQFIVQIDLGATNQQKNIAKFEYDVQAHKKMWVESQVKCKAMGILIEKRMLKKQHIENKKEQQLLDEICLLKFLEKKQKL